MTMWVWLMIAKRKRSRIEVVEMSVSDVAYSDFRSWFGVLVYNTNGSHILNLPWHSQQCKVFLFWSSWVSSQNSKSDN